ncbi:hypothetical protein JL722_9149 [Aureococcus anophagefferens]|nr:hypothetical protein JL722_9149 [Aureococcus anophagefferens]
MLFGPAPVINVPSAPAMQRWIDERSGWREKASTRELPTSGEQTLLARYFSVGPRASTLARAGARPGRPPDYVFDFGNFEGVALKKMFLRSTLARKPSTNRATGEDFWQHGPDYIKWLAGDEFDWQFPKHTLMYLELKASIGRPLELSSSRWLLPDLRRAAAAFDDYMKDAFRRRRAVEAPVRAKCELRVIVDGGGVLPSSTPDDDGDATEIRVPASHKILARIQSDGTELDAGSGSAKVTKASTVFTGLALLVTIPIVKANSQSSPTGTYSVDVDEDLITSVDYMSEQDAQKFGGAVIHGIPKSQWTFFQTTIADMNNVNHERSFLISDWDSTKLLPPKVDSYSAARDFDLRPITFIDPTDEFKDRFECTPCVNHGYDHSNSVTRTKKWSIRRVKGMSGDEFIASRAAGVRQHHVRALYFYGWSVDAGARWRLRDFKENEYQPPSMQRTTAWFASVLGHPVPSPLLAEADIKKVLAHPELVAKQNVHGLYKETSIYTSVRALQSLNRRMQERSMTNTVLAASGTTTMLADPRPRPSILLMADDDAVAELAEAVDVGWILVCTALVFWEQAGFAMLEAGSVRARNLGNILFKNLLDVSLGAVVFAAVGYGLAFGDSASGVVGSTGFFLRSLESPYDYAIWAWHWSFAATAARRWRCVAERVDCVAYLVAATLVTGVVYAVPVHWVWADGGCMSVWHGTTLLDVGVIDFAGSGLVHMVGGLGGLVGSVMLGPRLGRFPADAYRRSVAARLAVAGAREPDAGKGKADDLRGFAGHNATLTALGVYCLWFGWFGFNAGCSGGLSAAAPGRGAAREHGARAALRRPRRTGRRAVARGLLVAAGDGAIAIHAFPGAWGVLASGLFATDARLAAAGYDHVRPGLFAGGGGVQLGAQALGVALVAAWACAASALSFLAGAAATRAGHG